MSNIQGHLRLLAKMILRASVRFAFFIPVKKNKILFYVGTRGYTCNPKYVCEYLNSNYPGQFELCWIGKDKNELKDYPYISFVKYSPLSIIYALASSKVFVTSGENAICPKCNKRLIVCTWHGAVYKKIGFDAPDLFSQRSMSKSAVDLFISLSREYTEHCIHSGFNYHGNIINSGYPRNDIFFDRNRMQAAAEKVRLKYGITGVFVLYAPTYRGVYQTANKLDLRLDFKRLEDAIKARYGSNYTIGVRMHYFDKNVYDFPAHVVDVGSWPDMQEVMSATDILITDYSSTIWDFCLTRRPCLLYVPDLEDYKTNRGLYTEPEIWPGVLCENMDKLCDEIIHLDEAKCRMKAERYLKNTGSYEKGVASELVAREIIKFCKI